VIYIMHTYRGSWIIIFVVNKKEKWGITPLLYEKTAKKVMFLSDKTQQKKEPTSVRQKCATCTCTHVHSNAFVTTKQSTTDVENGKKYGQPWTV